MAESTPLRIVMAPKTKRAVALGLAVEAYDDYTEKVYNPETDRDESQTNVGRWADAPQRHAANVVDVARVFLNFLDEEQEDAS